MELMIGKLSEREINEFTPFEIKGNVKYAYNLYIDKGNDYQIYSQWFDHINIFPLYIFLDVHFYMNEKFEEHCKENKVDYEYIQTFEDGFCAFIIVNSKQTFTKVVPIIDLISTMEDCIVLSTNINAIIIDKEVRIKNGFTKFPITVNFDQNTTIFAPTAAGLSLDLFSNEEAYSSFEKIRNNLPETIKLVLND